eukprot:scaffold45_cov368-Prasinococcus_capsulatus_cf.AAC.1
MREYLEGPVIRPREGLRGAITATFWGPWAASRGVGASGPDQSVNKSERASRRQIASWAAAGRPPPPPQRLGEPAGGGGLAQGAADERLRGTAPTLQRPT